MQVGLVTSLLSRPTASANSSAGDGAGSSSSADVTVATVDSYQVFHRLLQETAV